MEREKMERILKKSKIQLLKMIKWKKNLKRVLLQEKKQDNVCYINYLIHYIR